MTRKKPERARDSLRAEILRRLIPIVEKDQEALGERVRELERKWRTEAVSKALPGVATQVKRARKDRRMHGGVGDRRSSRLRRDHYDRRAHPYGE